MIICEFLVYKKLLYPNKIKKNTLKPNTLKNLVDTLLQADYYQVLLILSP